MQSVNNRYGVINEKNYREIVLLKGGGCKWRSCLFCDYHNDGSSDTGANFSLNKKVLSQVDGRYSILEVINSGSFSDLDEKTVAEILKVCKNKRIKTLHFESHWNDREKAIRYKEIFKRENIAVKMKIGVETFDEAFRKKLGKNIPSSPAEIAEFFDECCLLFGIGGQSEKSMLYDIETGLLYFDRVCVNIMQKNSAKISPDDSVIEIFRKKVYPKYKDEERVDILFKNTDFGVG